MRDPKINLGQSLGGGRPFACLFIATAIAASWLGMTALHELGHVLHAWLSGGQVQSVELPPRRFGQAGDGRQDAGVSIVAFRSRTG